MSVEKSRKVVALETAADAVSGAEMDESAGVGITMGGGVVVDATVCLGAVAWSRGNFSRREIIQ